MPELLARLLRPVCTPFVCVLLAQDRQLDIPFGTKMGLIDYLLHRLEKACYDSTQRSLPQLLDLICLKSHGQIDLKVLVSRVQSGQGISPKGHSRTSWLLKSEILLSTLMVTISDFLERR